MFVENFYKYCRYIMSDIAGSANDSRWTNTGVKNTSGSGISIFSTSYNTLAQYSLYNYNLFYDTSIYLSDETQEPNYTDYALPPTENNLSRKLSLSAKRDISYDSERKKMRVRYTVSGTCISDAPVNIRQIYITKRVWISSGTTDTILLAKCPLKDKAIYLEKYDSFSFDYEIVL